MTIHKKELPMAPGCNLNLPKGAKILCVQAQRNVPCIWYSFKGDPGMETRSFVIVMTGGSVEQEGFDKYTYLGSFQLDNGSFVGHVYYV